MSVFSIINRKVLTTLRSMWWKGPQPYVVSYTVDLGTSTEVLLTPPAGLGSGTTARHLYIARISVIHTANGSAGNSYDLTLKKLGDTTTLGTLSLDTSNKEEKLTLYEMTATGLNTASNTVALAEGEALYLTIGTTGTPPAGKTATITLEGMIL